MHPRVLRGPADVVAKPLSFIFKKSQWSGKVPNDWKRREILLLFSKRGERKV